jgi:hypothetical protein
MTKEVELHNQGHTSTFHFNVVYPLPTDVARYFMRIGAALPFKSYHPKASEH